MFGSAKRNETLPRSAESALVDICGVERGFALQSQQKMTVVADRKITQGVYTIFYNFNDYQFIQLFSTFFQIINLLP